MTKSLSNLLSAGALSLSLLAASSASAEVIFTETFSYPPGNLYGNPGWMQSNNEDNPIQVTSTTLSLDGFASGNSVRLAPVSSTDQDVLRPFYAANADGTYNAITDGSVYAAMLINVQNATDLMYVTAFGTINSKNTIKDSSSFTGPFGMTFVGQSTTPGKYRFGISKYTAASSATLSATELDYGTTYLIVLKYTAIPGTTNDTFTAWINPVAGDSEPATADITADTSKGDPSRGVAAFAICQTTSSKQKCPEMLVGPVRLASSWDELWSDGGGTTPDPDDKGSITAGKLSLPEGFALYQFQKYTTTVNIKASAITDDIVITGNSAVKPAVTTISAAEACSANGYNLKLTIDATAGTDIDETLTFTSGQAIASLPVKATVYPANTLASFRLISTIQPYETYYFSGKATVTFVDAANKKIYLQDVVGGMALDYSWTGLDASPFKLGDQLTKLYIMGAEPETTGGQPGCMLLAYYGADGIEYGTVSATDQSKEPLELTLADLNNNRDMYLNRLVKVNDVTFASAGSNFSTAGTDITTEDASGKVRAFAGTDIIGTTIPQTAKAVVGISTSTSATMITMRSLADLIASPADEEKLEVTEQLLVDANEYYPVNVTTPFAKFTVKAQNLAKAAAIYVTGKDRSHFSADLTEIPAGTGEYVITVSFKPTSTGRKQGNLMIETSNTELTYNKGFAAQAYDPDNLPVFSVDNSAVTEFSAKVGETQEQTVIINATGLLDYGSIRVLGQGNGAFRIGSTMFLKDGQTTLKVTFAPTAEGTFTEVIEFSAAKAETKTITVTGKTASGAVAGDKEGDELVFDTANPLKYYATDFSNSGANNKPLALEGWKNVAIDGKRAWWSYNDNGNTVAKVTSYIWGGATSNEPNAEMLLLSPALDYKNCTTRLLSFRIKGNLLSAGQMGQLSVLYIDPTLPEDQRYQVLLGGSDIPTGADAAGEWAEYVVDLEGLDLADVFFIGFHYISGAGATSPESYYVDDFCYGSTTQPFIRVDKHQVTTTAEVGKSKDLETITVTGLNLTEPIAVALEGQYKGLFTGYSEQLPAEGGELNFKYSPVEEGEHNVYVNLTSAGAPATQLIIGGKADNNSGITLPGVDNASEITVYDLQGRTVVPATGAAEAYKTLRTLDKDIYVLRITSADGTVKTIKYVRP